jgi:hypothetical protein
MPLHNSLAFNIQGEKNKVLQPALLEQFRQFCFGLFRRVLLQMDTKQHFRAKDVAPIFRVEDYSFTLIVETIPDHIPHDNYFLKSFIPNKFPIWRNQN